ncbi:hypothetical protein F5B22DRAFT_106267 [Xylaria bambusicola]|uniref:uncharacterized protein n=1 Tax=Xylaria bambusicola TaxID=326684 RepID=UPI002007896B|nr:uncharacterized protein F5B22DRAFT_106267 [Xylaria bambusicola]KAI0517469.1 hypothetical protein F5B22DRAFT_106267 [Xylaria bambusicola]
MDPLSVTAAVAGILKAAQEIVKLLRPYVSASERTPPIVAYVRDEAESTRTVLIGLQTLVQVLPGRFSLGGAFITISQVVAILTSGVLLFGELEGAVRGLVAAPSALHPEHLSVRRFSLTQDRLPLSANIRWTQKEASLKVLLERLKGFKVSVTAVLTLLQCDSNNRAEQLQLELVANVEGLLHSNRELSRRMMHLEDAFNTATIRPRSTRTIESVLTLQTENTMPAVEAQSSLAFFLPESATPLSFHDTQPGSEFEKDLKSSRVYRQVRRETMDFSFRSSVARTHAWSLLSSYSLADLSVLSVIALPLDLEEVTNSHHYIDISEQPLASPIEEEPFPRTHESSLIEKNSVFHECVKIYLQLVQISGFQKLFDSERQLQVEGGIYTSAVEQGVDNEWILQLDLFRALKSIFHSDAAYGLLADELGWSLDQPYLRNLSSTLPLATGMRISAFWNLYKSSEFRSHPRNNFNLHYEIGDSNVSFLNVLSCISKILDRLASDRAMDILSDNDINTILYPIQPSMLQIETYEPALNKLVAAVRSSVRDLHRLINAVDRPENLASRPSLRRTLRETSTFLSFYTSSQIELLITFEKMLLAPNTSHRLWASAVRQWCATAESHYKLAITSGIWSGYSYLQTKFLRAPNNTRQFDTAEAQGDVFAGGPWYYSTIKEDLEFTFPRIAELFQDLLSIAIDDSYETAAFPMTQKTKCLRLIEDTSLVLIKWLEQMEQYELYKTLNTMIPGFADWRYFGFLVQSEELEVQVSNKNDNIPKMVQVCLFEKALFCLEYESPASGRGKLSYRAAISPMYRLTSRVYLSNDHIRSSSWIARNAYAIASNFWTRGKWRDGMTL